MISYFIAGILVGWVLEWLFFTFWVKEEQSASHASAADVNSLKSELSAKNIEIASLKSKLYKTDDSASASADSKVVSTTAKATTNATSTMTSDASTAKSTTASSTASATKKADSKTTDKKPVAKEATEKSEEADGAKGKATSPKASTSKKAEPKTATKKPATKAKRVVGKNKSGHDDFTLLSGIGPSAASKINEIGIMTFSDLAAMEDDDLREKLEAAGARLNSNKVTMDSWNEQATLASKGDFDGLKKLQATLKL